MVGVFGFVLSLFGGLQNALVAGTDSPLATMEWEGSEPAVVRQNVALHN
jgi:hypothetical protein